MKSLTESINGNLNKFTCKDKDITNKIRKILDSDKYLEPYGYTILLADIVEELNGTINSDWKQIKKAEIGHSSWSGANIYETEIKSINGKVIGKLAYEEIPGPAGSIKYYYINNDNEEITINENEYGHGVIISKTHVNVLNVLYLKINNKKLPNYIRY